MERKHKNVSQALAEELLYWRRTGAQDCWNVSSPREDAELAGVRASDNINGARQKILKMLLKENQIDSFNGREIDGPWTDAEKRKLLLAWATAWANAAAQSCLESIQERARRDDD